MKRKTMLKTKLVLKYALSVACMVVYYASFMNSTTTDPLENIICALIMVPSSAYFLYSTLNDKVELKKIKRRELKSRRQKKCSV